MGIMVVVTNLNSEYYGLIGEALPMNRGWQTQTVMFGCLAVQFHSEDFRPFKVGIDRVDMTK